MKLFNKIIYLSVASALSAGASSSFAGGFGIGTQSGSGTGNAFAGGAAVAEDASVVWSNPAGMTALPMGYQLTGALHSVRTSFKFSNAGSTGAFNAPGAFDGGDAGNWNFIPNGFFAMSVTPGLRVGLAINVPYGLKTDYDFAWRGQITALKSEIQTLNIQPSVAYKINDMFSIGAGLDFQRINATLSNFAGAAAGYAKLTADDWGYGFNVGATFQPTTTTRIGATYRSHIQYNLEGNAGFVGGPASNLVGGTIKADLTVPASASLSLLQQVMPNLDVMGDVTWTDWSSVQQLAVVRTSASAGGPVGSILTNLPFQWSDTWRFSLGSSYRLNPQVKLRFGVAYDKTPTNDQFRTPRLPDQDRTWLAFGVQFKPSKQGTLEFAYAHEFVKNASINTPVTGQTTCAAGCLVGNFKDKADILSIQYSHAF